MKKKFKQSWLYDELYQSRTFGSVIHTYGAIVGGIINSINHNIFMGKLPISVKDNKDDYTQLAFANKAEPIIYPKPDNEISFDKLSSVYLSNTNHQENQPCHLTLQEKDIPILVNLAKFDEPAVKYCPAGVYEIESTEQGLRFVINSQNCIHCKTCDIKDPSQNITWVAPEGGGGPNYTNM